MMRKWNCSNNDHKKDNRCKVCTDDIQTFGCSCAENCANECSCNPCPECPPVRKVPWAQTQKERHDKNRVFLFGSFELSGTNEKCLKT